MSDSAITGELLVSDMGEAKRFFPAAVDSATPSIKVFQAPQLGHLPNHLGELPPHSVQLKVVLSLAMLRSYCFYSQFIYDRICGHERGAQKLCSHAKCATSFSANTCATSSQLADTPQKAISTVRSPE
jgi:hypothetical protein